MQKILAALIAVWLFAFPAAAYVQAPVVQSGSFYVNDYANILFDTHRADILELSRGLYEQTGAQVVVLTVETLGDYSVDEYGQAVISGWGIGGAQGENGALILVALEEKVARVFIGEGLDSLADYRDAQMEVGSNNISRAVMNIYRPLVSDIYAQHGITPDEATLGLLDNTPAPEAKPFTIGSAIFIAAVLVVALRGFRSGQKYRQKYLKGYVRKTKGYSRSYNEEDEYSNEKIYRIDYDGDD